MNDETEIEAGIETTDDDTAGDAELIAKHTKTDGYVEQDNL